MPERDRADGLDFKGRGTAADPHRRGADETGTDETGPFVLRPIGVVRSGLTRREDCPRQGVEGGPEAEIQIDPAFAGGLTGIEPGTELILLTWLHRGRRDVLQVHPRGDRSHSLKGVFLTRSPDRPNPIGLHRVRTLSVDGCRIRVTPLEVLDGTPLADIKIALSRRGGSDTECGGEAPPRPLPDGEGRPQPR